MRTVIKLSSQLTAKRVWPYVRIIIEAQKRGDQIVVVSGGAVKRGAGILGFNGMSTLQQQGASGLGQIKLMESWTASARKLGFHTAQLLYTHHDLLDNDSNIEQVIGQYFEWGNILVVANGNDVAIDEETRLTAKVSENSALARLLAERIKADTLVLLGSQQGIYSANPKLDPNASLIRKVTDYSDNFINQFSDEAAEGSFGGAKTNVLNCIAAAKAGIKVIVASGFPPNNLRRILNGEDLGTIFPAISFQ